MDPVYVTQTTIAVTILHTIHYSIEVPKTKKQKKTDYWFSKYNRVLHHYSVSIAAAACYGFDQYFGCFENLQSIIIWERCATGSDVTEKDVTGKDVTGSDVSQVTGSDVSHMTGSIVSHVTGSDIITGSDVIFPALFSLKRVVVQNVPLLFFIRFTVSDYSFVIFWSLCCLSFVLLLF